MVIGRVMCAMHSNASLAVFFLSILLLAPLANAHNPVIVKNRSSQERPVAITRPEISYAYYGRLTGEPHFYRIDAPRPFLLYVNILVPDLKPGEKPVMRHDVNFEILKDDSLLHAALGLESDWRRFFEPFGHDHYYLGPEFEKPAAPGTYLIKVFNRTNRGKYALAVGKKERFTPWGLIGAFFKARALDRWFFKDDESPAP